MLRFRPALLGLTLLAAGCLTATSGCDNSVDVTVPDPEAVPDGWTLVWADEFDGASLDTTKWSLQLGDGCPDLCGWGNQELQVYTDRNHTVGGGLLTITARREADGSYTSTRMRTLGKGDWTYGRFVARARVPQGQGLWSAVWMLFSEDTYGGWAASGEIDIMEAIGSRPNEVLGTIHYGGPAPANVFTGDELTLFSGSFATDFYVFAVEWEEGEIRWYVNNVLYQTQTSDDWYTTGSDDPAAPFDHDFHLLLNVAVGGILPGNPDETTVFPQSFEVDYVRVYQRSTAL